MKITLLRKILHKIFLTISNKIRKKLRSKQNLAEKSGNLSSSQ